MKLYYSPGACSLAVHIIIQELGLSCELEVVNLKSKETSSGKDFWKINPKGQVPVLVLDNQEVLTENLAILQYLAEKTDAVLLLPPVGEFKRYRVLEWLVFVSTELHKGFGPFFNPRVPHDAREDVFKPLLKKKFQWVEDSLKEKDYLLGEMFTLPDAYLFVMLTWFPAVKISLSDFPRLSAYYARLKQRESIQKALKEEGILG